MGHDPSGTRGVLNDALSIYFADATLASAFVARWCVGAKVETAGGVYRVREDEPEPRVGAGLHRTPLRRRDRVGKRDERSPLDRYDLGMDTRRRPKCAFSGWCWPERLL
jgi:hypothetical protein